MGTQRQESSASTAQIINGEPPCPWVAVLPSSTVVPMREERRCRRLWFFYHDIRAFSTSWLPPILFTIYRLVHFGYFLAWLIAALIVRSNEGPKWLIFITNQAYLLLVACFGSFTIFNVVYTVVYYCKPSYLVQFYPHEDSPKARIYSQDNIGFYVKILWLLYIVACTMSLVVTAGFWVIVFDISCVPQSEFDAIVNSSNTTNATTLPDICVVPDGVTIQLHGMNIVLVIIDMFVSRVPYQLLHFLYPCLFTAFYIIFAAIYTGAGGTNENDEPFIYSALDYKGNPVRASLLSILLVVVPMAFYFPFFLLAWLRDFIYQKFHFFYRDIQGDKMADCETDGVGGNNRVVQAEPGSKVAEQKDMALTTL